SGIISYQPARRTRGVRMLDEHPVKQLRIRPQEIARRAALEQRKLREMINFCYTDGCYRAFILDYFGDPHHAQSCGTCGNCDPRMKGASARSGSAAPPPIEPPTKLDRFVREQVPFAHDLEDDLGEQSRMRRAREKSEAAAKGEEMEGALGVTTPRALTAEESLLVRKVLACSARMQGRFGKGMLASTLRGSRAKQVLQAGLDQLSTYGILSDMTQDEILLYIDALVAAGCLRVAGGVYPTVSLTEMGSDVMRERASVELAIAETSLSALAHQSFVTSRTARALESVKRVNTVDETYTLYCDGLSIEEISRQRGLTEITIEKHLADCIQEGREFDISLHVSDADRARIEIAIEQLGTQQLRPLRDALPAHINYRMIRFVVADVQRVEQNSSDKIEGGL
ncbi:MAG TPA: helix-turn-helix domain-containing protein, partial [Pyrinomonadaceae bacterium]|nr:helix-turn-helix domain-containing protein [Pyrinomonadaceae bacterium]